MSRLYAAEGCGGGGNHDGSSGNVTLVLTCLLHIRYCSKQHVWVTSFNPDSNSVELTRFNFFGEETEAQRGHTANRW